MPIGHSLTKSNLCIAGRLALEHNQYHSLHFVNKVQINVPNLWFSYKAWTLFIAGSVKQLRLKQVGCHC